MSNLDSMSDDLNINIDSILSEFYEHRDIGKRRIWLENLLHDNKDMIKELVLKGKFDNIQISVSFVSKFSRYIIWFKSRTFSIKPLGILIRGKHNKFSVRHRKYNKTSYTIFNSLEETIQDILEKLYD